MSSLTVPQKRVLAVRVETKDADDPARTVTLYLAVL